MVRCSRDEFSSSTAAMSTRNAETHDSGATHAILIDRNVAVVLVRRKESALRHKGTKFDDNHVDDWFGSSKVRLCIVEFDRRSAAKA
jgi:hypothetical protein